MTKFANQIDFFDIIIEFKKDQPALLKFINDGGVPSIFDICTKIRENKSITLENSES